MTEPIDNLESRLSSLRPRPITASLESRISKASTRPVPTRAALSIFWTTVAGGAIAASTILVLLTTHSAGSPSSAAPSVNVATAQRSNLALADLRWGDDLYLNESRRLP
jgi:hypothetical protein